MAFYLLIIYPRNIRGHISISTTQYSLYEIEIEQQLNFHIPFRLWTEL